MSLSLLLPDEAPGVQRVEMICLTSGSKAGGGARPQRGLPGTQPGVGAAREGLTFILALPTAYWDLTFGSTLSWPLGGTMSKKMSLMVV